MKFADYFGNCYGCNNRERAAKLEHEYASMRDTYSGYPLHSEFCFDTELVSHIASELKRGKAPGLDGLAAEHLFYAHPSICVVLSKLFYMLLQHRYVPAGFRTNYIVPLQKSGGYRAKAMKCNDLEESLLVVLFQRCSSIVF